VRFYWPTINVSQKDNNDIVEIRCKQSHYDALLSYFTKKISRHQLSGPAVTTALSIWETRMKRNQGIISGKLSYQNGKTPAYLVFQAFAILFHKRNGNIATGKRACILTNSWIDDNSFLVVLWSYHSWSSRGFCSVHNFVFVATMSNRKRRLVLGPCKN